MYKGVKYVYMLKKDFKITLITSIITAIVIGVSVLLFQKVNNKKNASINIVNVIDSFAYKKELEQELEKERSRMSQSLDTLEQSIKQLYSAIESETNKNTKNELIRQYEVNTNHYTQMKEKLNEEYNKYAEKFNKQLNDRLEMYIHEYIEKNNIEVLYGLQPSIHIYTSKTLDITSDVISFINYKYENKTLRK